MYLESIVLSPKKPPMVRLELEIQYQKSINRETRLLGVGDNLFAPRNLTTEQEALGYADATREAALAIADSMLMGMGARMDAVKSFYHK